MFDLNNINAPKNPKNLGLSKKAHAAGIALFILITGLLALRITKGIDFSDEAYYAFFVSDWLFSSISKSTLITLHQTAALIVYPAAYLFKMMTGSTDGLFLFLRSLFLLGNILAAFFWMFFLRRAGYTLPVWLGGILVLSFIPFGLPAPSYNSLSSQALIIALAMLGCAILCKNQSRGIKFGWLATSAIFWSIATIAYPSLIFAVIFLSLLGLFYGSKKYPYPWVYLSFLMMTLFLGWGIIIYTLSLNKLINSIKYLSALNDPLDYIYKLQFIFTLFINNKLFSSLCLLSIMIGLFRKLLNTYILMLSISALMISLLFITPVLFVRSHDAITLLALTGLGFLFDLRKKATEEERTIALIYATSLLAAFITGTTAFHSIFNFCIGAAPAAYLAVFPSPQQAGEKKFRWVSLLPVVITILILLSTSLFFYYGEISRDQPRIKINSGFFAGISAYKDDIVLLDIVNKQVTPLLSNNNSLAIFARTPGIVLDLPIHIKMPFVYPLIPLVKEKGRAATRSFYENTTNRSAIVLIYRDPYFNIINPMEPHFNEWYKHLSSLKTPLGVLDIYQQRLA